MKAALAVLVLGVSGCAIPAAGTRCEAGVAYCSSKTAALACRGGVLAQYACSGPKGCSLGSGRAVLCDQSSGASDSAPCFPEYEGRAECGADAGVYLVCSKGAWAGVACVKGTACHDDGGVVCR